MLSAARTLGIVVAAIALAGGGFAAGRLTAPDASSTASQCSEPRKLYRKYVDAITPEQDVAQKRTNGRMLANVTLQNPDCFSSEDRASAQTILDTIDQGVQQDSINDLKECVDSATDDYSWSNC
ncbi:hypothetical protein ABZV24_22430 [Streptomyces sp. NPDC005251]|uniref:hypothetical protein n=1 Tax=Streptomyces sp. NPDC005251 TaxID=3157166 RepID=UPI0033B7F157